MESEDEIMPQPVETPQNGDTAEIAAGKLVESVILHRVSHHPYSPGVGGEIVDQHEISFAQQIADSQWQALQHQRNTHHEAIASLNEYVTMDATPNSSSFLNSHLDDDIMTNINSLSQQVSQIPVPPGADPVDIRRQVVSTLTALPPHELDTEFSEALEHRRNHINNDILGLGDGSSEAMSYDHAWSITARHFLAGDRIRHHAENWQPPNVGQIEYDDPIEPSMDAAPAHTQDAGETGNMEVPEPKSDDELDRSRDARDRNSGLGGL